MTSGVKTAASTERAQRKTRIGIVVSNKMTKTISIELTRQVPHPLYKKYFKKTKKLMVHDEHQSAGIGDKVLVMETRPLSKVKRWRLVEIIQRAK